MYNHQLDTFIQVADAGSFSKAAEALYISSTAVMKQINLLEGSLGVQLFHRTPWGLALTDAGKSYYQDAKYMIQYAKDAQTRAKNAMQANDSVIRIGTSPMTPGQFLVSLWPQIQERCPDIKFQMVTFANTPENSVNILRNLGQNIDIVAGLFDDAFLKERRCAGLELCRTPILCAVSIYHPLAARARLQVEDLHGEDFMLIKRGWNKYLDAMRDDLWRDHPQVHIIDFDMFNIEVFNRCENSNNVLMTIDAWENVHPLLKTLPVDWDYSIPYGLLYSPSPSPTVERFLQAVSQVFTGGESSPRGFAPGPHKLFRE